MGDRAKWDRRYQAQAQPVGLGAAATVLQAYRHLLPGAGRALDLASGLGANAVLLAAQGLAVEAWDLSPVAIGRLRAQAQGLGLTLTAEVRDVVANPPAPASFDVIVVSRFLERDLCPAIAAALRPGGLLFYQTFIQDKANDIGPSNPAFLLAPNELLRLFPSLRILAYHEEGVVGDVSQGLRDEAMLVAQRPG